MLKRVLLGLGGLLVVGLVVFLVYDYLRNEERGPGEETASWKKTSAIDPVLYEIVVPGRDITTLQSPQGWSDGVRNAFRHQDQGSLLAPYDIFTNLAAAGRDDLFISAENMAQYRYLPSPASDSNPDALPIGFTKGEQPWQGEIYAGMTCSACHSSLVMFKNTALLIDGAPTQADFQTMSVDLSRALTAAYEDTAVFDALAARMGVSGSDAISQLRQRVERTALAMAERIELNATPVRYGFGRLDAVGQIYNSVSSANLNAPENRSAPSAPVSYPFIWGTGQSDVVQWTGFAPNAAGGMLVRNAGEVLGVFGGITVTDQSQWLEKGFDSSVNVKALGDLEEWVNTLEPPAWPTEVFGPIDIDKAAAGKALYETNCQSCHAVVTPYEIYKATLTKVSDVGTDPTAMQTTLETATVNGETQAKLDVLVKQTIGALVNQPAASLESATAEALPDSFGAQGSDTYKARPLNAIWATAPYLHNGSVPTLMDLLLPPSQRPGKFTTGGWEFDPTKVGLAPYDGPNGFTLTLGDAPNGNQGHEFGTGLTQAEREALVEYLKTL